MTDTASASLGSESRWAKVIDHGRCIGCHACSTACKSENEVPLSVHRTYVKYVDVGEFPTARRAFQVTRCNQCEDPPCATACPTAAMYARTDGIVDFDKSICIGCKACIASCPYDAIFINPEDNAAEKCNLCAHRIDVGLEPACAVVCPTEAIFVGDLSDRSSRVAQVVGRDVVAVRRPEKETRPKLFYKGAHQATLDPLAAERPGGGLFLWSEQGCGPSGIGNGRVTSGHPAHANSSAQAMLAYDVPHQIPWDYRVSLYTWTKGIASGVYLVMALLFVLGGVRGDSPVWRITVPVLGGAALALTGALLIWDLKHPERFLLIFKRPQWRSWLVRGAFLILGYSIVLGLHFLAGLAEADGVLGALVWVGIPLALGTAVYTAFLFAQAKARDLWQSPLLPPHLAVQALLAGSAVLIPFAMHYDAELVPGLRWLLAISCAVHVLFVLGEITLTHPTAHARLAVREMIRGKYRPFFWAGFVLVAFGMFASIAHVEFGALLGLLLYEHAYVQAGQSVPLA